MGPLSGGTQHQPYAAPWWGAALAHPLRPNSQPMGQGKVLAEVGARGTSSPTAELVDPQSHSNESPAHSCCPALSQPGAARGSNKAAVCKQHSVHDSMAILSCLHALHSPVPLMCKAWCTTCCYPREECMEGWGCQVPKTALAACRGSRASLAPHSWLPGTACRMCLPASSQRWCWKPLVFNLV